jgi:hypothetical protein
MPINPNIALGAQQPAPVNYLGQMGQAMALKAAAQDIQGNEELRAAYASGGDLNDPEFRRRVMAANPKLGSELIKRNAETSRIGAEALTKAYANSREALSMVRTPEDLLAYSVSQFNDPLIGPSLKSRGLTPETVAANLQKELSTSGFENVLKKSAMGLDGWFKDQTSRRNQDVSSGASYGQLDLARKKDAREQQEFELIRNVLSGGGTAPAAAPMTGGGAPVAGAQAPTQPNALAPQAAPAPNVNALAGGGDAQQQISAIDAKINALMGAGSKATPIVQALIAQKNSILNAEAANYGPEREVELTDPDTEQRYMGLARLDKRTNQYVPLSIAEPPITVGGTSPTSASANVAKPKPSAQTEKERLAIQKLPEAISMSDDAIRKIDEMIGPSNKDIKDKSGKIVGVNPNVAPGFSGAVGAGFGMQYIPGTDARGFRARHDEVLSQAFLDAFETLKGGGAITEKEGEKATAARTRMNLATSEIEYIRAAREYQDVLKRGIESARQRAQRSGGSAAPAASGNVIDFGSLK